MNHQMFKLAQILHWDEGNTDKKSLCHTYISIRCTYIRNSKGWGPIILELLPFVKFLNAVKSLCAHYLFNQWLEFDQTSTDTSSGWGKEVIRIWGPWPYFQGHYIMNTKKVSLVCTLSFFLHILINIIRNLNIFCMNVHMRCCCFRKRRIKESVLL